MNTRDLIRSLTPPFVLQILRSIKKKRTRQNIEKELQIGEALSCADLEKEFRSIGIHAGDSVLVHCAFSKIGPVAGGPETFIQALKNVVGAEGNILMPSSPNDSFQLEYIQKIQSFDVQNEPSKMGWLSETFRKSEHVLRSVHPAEPVCAWGKNARWLTENHELDGTAYGKNSPFYKLTEINGKILYIGVTLDNAGTSLHILEDAVQDFPYPVYRPESYKISILNEGRTFDVVTKVHNPEQSKKRKCDQLLPLFEEENVAIKVKIGMAPTWLFEAKPMLEVMLNKFQEKGVTMYTPKG
ncbi:MAG: AAC(3) family N-acetyltransferase [Crocinitomicaceae bacterium]